MDYSYSIRQTENFQHLSTFPFSNQKLDRTWKYQAAIILLGWTDFEAVRTHWKGQPVRHLRFYVNGWPLPLACRLIRSQLRDREVKFQSGWLRDTLILMAHKALGVHR